MATMVLLDRAHHATVPLSHFPVPSLQYFEVETSKVPFEHENMEKEWNAQHISPLFSRLPGELRNQIYELAMTSAKPIIDPSMPPTYTAFAQAMNYRTDHHRIPDLSTQLLRTCRRMYQEISPAALYSRNTFRFTTSFGAHRFLTALPEQFRAMIQDVEIDFREVNDAHPAVEREWIQYLQWKPHTESLWTAKVGSLHVVAPNIRTLRFNIECWRVQETMRSIALLKEMMQGPHGLQRIVMTGTDGSELLFGSRQRYLDKWGPVAFVGVMRFARLAGMTDWMANAIDGTKEDKIVVWEKQDTSVRLEIMTRDEYKSQTGNRGPFLDEHANYNHVKGACSLEAYERRWQSCEWPAGGSH